MYLSPIFKWPYPFFDLAAIQSQQDSVLLTFDQNLLMSAAVGNIGSTLVAYMTVLIRLRQDPLDIPSAAL